MKNKRPTENKAFWLIEKKDRSGLAAIRSDDVNSPKGGGELYKYNNTSNTASYRLDVRKPERTRDNCVTTPLYNMGVTK